MAVKSGAKVVALMLKKIFKLQNRALRIINFEDLQIQTDYISIIRS